MVLGSQGDPKCIWQNWKNRKNWKNWKNEDGTPSHHPPSVIAIIAVAADQFAFPGMNMFVFEKYQMFHVCLEHTHTNPYVKTTCF